MGRGIGIFVFLASLFAFDSVSSQSDVLRDYIDYAFENNLTVKQNSYSYNASVKAIAAAKAQYLPRVQLLSRYSVATGGRTFDIPSGSLLNPVFDNLNAINSSVGALDPSFGSPNRFNELGDEEVKFLREKEQQSNLRVEWPILNDDIKHGYEQQKLKSKGKQIELNAFKKYLAKEVQIAYYQHMKALEALATYRSDMKEVLESKRLVDALFKLGRRNALDVEEVELEEMEVAQNILEAQSDSLSTQIFFNYLINTAVDDPIKSSKESNYLEPQQNVDQLIQSSVANADMLQLADVNVMVANEALNNEKNNLKPKLSLIGDAGIQGTTYTFRDDAKFAQATLALRWDILDFSRKHKKDELRIEKEIQQLSLDQYEQKLKSDLLHKYQDVKESKSAWDLAKSRTAALSSIVKQKHRLYQNGQITFFEWSQTRTKHSKAANLELIDHYEYLIKCAELQWLCGTYNSEE